jgi:MFS family permease
MERRLVRRAALLSIASFFLQPLAIGGWLALIPLVKTDLGLSKAELAIALLGMPVALIPSLQVAGRTISRFGPRRVFRVFFPLQGLVILLPLFAWDLPSLFASLFLLGCVAAFLEVGINVYAGRLEKQTGAMIMNRAHGGWALGIMTGSGTVALLAGWPSFAVLAGLSAISVALGVATAFAMPALAGEENASSPPRRRLSALPAALIFVAFFMFLVTMTEGAMADWAAVYLAERLGEPDTARAGIAVTVFSGFMAGGRFIGDTLKRMWGAVRLARVTCTAALAGLLLLVLPLPVWMTYPGYALVGFGVSAAYPLGVSAIAALDDRYEAANIAIMATVALGGFLVGPPLIGFLAERFSLAVGLAALVPAILVALALTRWLRPESPVKTRRESV